MGNNPKQGMTARRRSPAEVSMPQGGIYILESHHSASFRMPKGSWPFHKLCWVPVGRGSLEIEDCNLSLDTGGFAIVPADCEHRFVDNPAEPMTLIIACVDRSMTEDAGSLALAFSDLCSEFPNTQPIRAKSAFHFSVIRDCFQQMLREQSRAMAGHSAMIHAQLMQLMVAFLRGAESGGSIVRTNDAALDGLLDELETQFDKPVSLEEVATRCGLSSRRFTQLFKQRTGVTLVDYINRKRIDYAKDRLRETGHVAYACYESGYQDLAYFYRAFKRYTGCTPGEYLKGEYK